MFKKIAMAAAMAVASAATTSFAAWDLFPVLPENKGEIKYSIEHNKFNDVISNSENSVKEPFFANTLNTSLSARYSVTQNLELALSLPLRIYTEVQGSDADVYGLQGIDMSARFQFIPQMNVFFDAEAPIGADYFTNSDTWFLRGGVQFSTVFNPMVNFGSEVGFNLETRGKRVASNIGFSAAIEADFTVLPQFTPYINSRLMADLGRFNRKDGYELSEGGEIGTWITVGSKFNLTQTIGLDAYYGFGIGDHYFGMDQRQYGLNLGWRF